jgi:hypothetical protein
VCVFNPVKHVVEEWRLAPRQVVGKKTAENNAKDIEADCLAIGVKPGDITTDTSEPQTAITYLAIISTMAVVHGAGWSVVLQVVGVQSLVCCDAD